MVVCYVKIMQHFKENQRCLSIVSRRVQKDLNKVLLAQAIIPILTAFLPMTLQITSVLTDFDLVFVTFVCGMLYSWIPFGNAITILIFITAYREKFKQLFFRSKKRIPRCASSPGTLTMNWWLLFISNSSTVTLIIFILLNKLIVDNLHCTA